MSRIIEINGIGWERKAGIKYRWAYDKWFDKILAGPPADYPKHGNWELSNYAYLIKTDIWFIVYFVLRIGCANCKFWVDACKDLEFGPKSHTLDLWAREHGKSSIITTAETIQDIVNFPESRIAIFSYTRAAALSFLRSIKSVFEQSELLKQCFPDVLYADPRTEAEKWAEETGLIVKRRGFYKEATLEAWGLIEGMPVGKHFTKRVYDDVVTQDLVNTPELMQRCKDAFDMSQNLGTIDGTHRVIGTPYHHEDVLVYLAGKKDGEGNPIYTVRKKPATVDGTANGRSVYLPEAKLAELRTNRQMFYSQQLLDPTPQGEQKLAYDLIREVSPSEIPKRLFKFMTVDPAGSGKRRQDGRLADAWAFCVVGVEPYLDDLGASELYILDFQVEPMGESDALDAIVKMYIRQGRILKLGVEKVAMSSAEVHVSNALRARGRSVTLDNGNLALLRPAGRSKAQRIESNLAWPLNNGKIHLSTGIPTTYRERLKNEMQKFPFWHDDGLDALSYVYDLIKDYRFGKRPGETDEDDMRGWYGLEARTKDGWLVV